MIFKRGLPELSRPLDLGENGVGPVPLAVVARVADVKVRLRSLNFPSDLDDCHPNSTDFDRSVSSGVEVRA